MKRNLVLLAISLMFGSAVLLATPVYGSVYAPADPIATIRSRYTAINKNLRRYRKVKKELSGYSAEGGMMEAFLDGNSVRKIVATHFGEAGKSVEEFYYWDGRLIFVFRKESLYDAPASAKVISTREERFYFDNDALIRWIAEGGKQVPSGQAGYAEKQRNYLSLSAELLKLANS